MRARARYRTDGALTSSRPYYDAVIVGAGMAGVSIGAELAAHMTVLMLEMESQPGYHATGRSVAFWTESYGGPGVAPLTRASLPLLEAPDPDFDEASFVSPRGAVHIGRQEDATRRERLARDFAGTGLFRPIGDDVLRAHVPGLKPGWAIGLEEASTRDIDVARLHAACLRRFRRRGGDLVCGAPLDAVRRGADGTWRIGVPGGVVRAGMIVNAAGAWADQVAALCGVAPVGIAPLKRTVVQLRVDPTVPDDLPLVLDLAGRFYFKPGGGGRLWLSPHDEQPHAPDDAAPDEIDVAVAIDRLQQVVDWRVDAVERRWAGLRSFAPDRLPVYGFDPDAAGFFWFAGQGGFGIQTAPAAARLALVQIVGGDDPALTGVDPALYSPARFR